jgi:hypothetical protein
MLHATMIFRGLASDKRPFRTVQRENSQQTRGAVKHAFSEADLMQACLQRTKLNAYSAGSATHAEECRTSPAAQPILLLLLLLLLQGLPRFVNLVSIFVDLLQSLSPSNGFRVGGSGKLRNDLSDRTDGCVSAIGLVASSES